jgi:asparagine synthase (glutamine-hydrolysing)
MCGITGFLSDDPRARAALPAMTAALAHRGPDADGFHCDGPVGLGHRRLSVIDIAGSRQPLVSADGAIAVVFNGEL